MTRALPLAFAATLAATPSFAAGLSQAALCGDGPNAIVATSGLGNGGFSCTGPLRPESPGGRAWIITGDAPDNEITITIDNSPIIGLNPQGMPRRAECGGEMAWTMQEYAGGYPIPKPPPVSVYEDSYDQMHYTATVAIETLFTTRPFKPNSNYSFQVKCLVRLYEGPN